MAAVMLSSSYLTNRLDPNRVNVTSLSSCCTTAHINKIAALAVLSDHGYGHLILGYLTWASETERKTNAYTVLGLDVINWIQLAYIVTKHDETLLTIAQICLNQTPNH